MSEEIQSLLPSPTYENGEGPRCPFCGNQFTADDPDYYDEKGFEDECPECGNLIRIEPCVQVSWKTIAIKRNPSGVVSARFSTPEPYERAAQEALDKAAALRSRIAEREGMARREWEV